MSELLEKYYPILAFEKAFWVMEWEKNYTLARISKGENFFYVTRKKQRLQAVIFLLLTSGEAVTLE
ncbi:hypothetical protein [Sporosarcina sp. A2]|uniref:hypothetical protein n=1 Tax=Sporosarcina sp. A2 TaxID=3393449 RepID=UPI003D7A1674